MPDKPRNFTAAEDVIRHLSSRIMTSGRTYQQIADGTNLSNSTIANIASGKTTWPRPKTFFALIVYFKIRMEFYDE